MTLIQIDIFSQLKNNQGFWDNFIWPLLLAIVIGIFIFIRNRIFRKKETKEIIPNLTIPQDDTVTFSSFQELCQRILPLLIENNYIFRTYGPNSSAHETEPLRMDMNLWKQSKNDYIVPNNDKIAELINCNVEIIPEHHKELFKKLWSHIYAFKKHIENENFDYAEFQFPKEIDKVIKDTCFRLVQEELYFVKVNEYLRSRFNDKRIKEVILFGSFLFFSNNKNDIDLAILLGDNLGTEKLNKISDKFERVKRKFLKRFRKRLHLTIFTGREFEKYSQFLNVNEYKFKVYG